MGIKNKELNALDQKQRYLQKCIRWQGPPVDIKRPLTEDELACQKCEVNGEVLSLSKEEISQKQLLIKRLFTDEEDLQKRSELSTNSVELRELKAKEKEAAEKAKAEAKEFWKTANAKRAEDKKRKKEAEKSKDDGSASGDSEVSVASSSKDVAPADPASEPPPSKKAATEPPKANGPEKLSPKSLASTAENVDSGKVETDVLALPSSCTTLANKGTSLVFESAIESLGKEIRDLQDKEDAIFETKAGLEKSMKSKTDEKKQLEGHQACLEKSRLKKSSLLQKQIAEAKASIDQLTEDLPSIELQIKQKKELFMTVRKNIAEKEKDLKEYKKLRGQALAHAKVGIDGATKVVIDDATGVSDVDEVFLILDRAEEGKVGLRDFIKGLQKDNPIVSAFFKLPGDDFIKGLQTDNTIVSAFFKFPSEIREGESRDEAKKVFDKLADGGETFSKDALAAYSR